MPPSTREGVIAVLETAVSDIAADKHVISTALVKNALEEIKAGAGC